MPPLRLLDPADEDELTFLIEAQHTQFEGALGSDEEMIIDGEPYGPAAPLTPNGLAFCPRRASDPAEPGGGPADGVSALRAVVAAPGSGKVTAASGGARLTPDLARHHPGWAEQGRRRWQ